MIKEVGTAENSEGNNANIELMKILLSDKEKDRNIEDSRTDISRAYDDKTKMWLERKNRNIEVYFK